MASIHTFSITTAIAMVCKRDLISNYFNVLFSCLLNSQAKHCFLAHFQGHPATNHQDEDGKSKTTCDKYRSEISISAIVLSLINLLLWFIVLVYVIIKDKNLQNQIAQKSLEGSPSVASAYNQPPKLSMDIVDRMISESVDNSTLIQRAELDASLDTLRKDLTTAKMELENRMEAVETQYMRFKLFWSSLVTKVGIELFIKITETLIIFMLKCVKQPLGRFSFSSNQLLSVIH